MSEKSYYKNKTNSNKQQNNNSDNPLTSRRTDGHKNRGLVPQKAVTRILLN